MGMLQVRKPLLVLFLVCCAAHAAAQHTKAELQLKFALIVMRHGVRAPTWMPERLNTYSSEPWPDFKVPPGHLTPRGRELMQLLGEFYRQYFSSERLLGQPACADASRTFLWADTDQRTLESAKAFAEALVPGCTVKVNSLPEGQTDRLFDPIDAGVVKPDRDTARAAVLGRVGRNLDALVDANRQAFDVLQRTLNGGGKASRSIFDEPISVAADGPSITMTGPLAAASTFTENLLLEYANGMNGSEF